MSDPADRPVRVLIVDDQRLIREGIASLLSLQPGIAVVGTAASGEDAVAQALAARPDVVLMDMRMPGMDGVAATAAIRAQVPGCQVLVLTTFDDEETIVEALRAGASGYLLKDIPAADLAQAVQAAHKGLYQLDSGIAGKLVAALVAPPALSPGPSPQRRGEPDSPFPRREGGGGVRGAGDPADLSSRELEVIRLIAQGATNREIAERLIISEGTVKNHISNILSRLGLRDRTQAAIYAREKGLL